MCVSHKVHIHAFSDAGRSVQKSQLCNISGLLIDQMAEGTIFLRLSWSSHKSRHPFKSIYSADILAADEAIDEGKRLTRTLSSIYNTAVLLIVALYGRNLFSSLSTKLNNVD